MELVYAFQGRLPPYIVHTIHQARCFHDGPITLLIDDLQSPHLATIAKYNVQIVPVENYIDQEFMFVVQENILKFCIAQNLGDRRLLFIRSFERFFVLLNWMRQQQKSNILFLELDMLIYFKPSDLLPLFSKRSMTFTHTENKHKCSAFFYVKDADSLKNLTDYFLYYIRNPENTKDISEMQAIWKWVDIPGVRDQIWMLPSFWKDERYHKDIWENFEAFQYTLFDSIGIAVQMDGPDETHRAEWERRGHRWWAVDVDYRECEIKWKTINGNRIVYLADKNQNEYKVQALHVHNKNLQAFLSKPLEELK